MLVQVIILFIVYEHIKIIDEYCMVAYLERYEFTTVKKIIDGDLAPFPWLPVARFPGFSCIKR
jgi:hypothetical protein